MSAADLEVAEHFFKHGPPITAVARGVIVGARINHDVGYENIGHFAEKEAAEPPTQNPHPVLVSAADDHIRRPGRFEKRRNIGRIMREVGVHFNAPASGDAWVVIMDLAGELVYEDRKALSGGEDEFRVSLRVAASGVYLCMLVIRSGGETVEATGKFAVVR